MTKTSLIAIGAAVVAFTVTFAVLYVFVVQPLILQDSSAIQTPTPTATPTLTPARDLQGTWKTTFPAKFNIQIDGQDVGYENRTMTWTITKTSQEGKVNVQVTFAGSGRELTPDSGYTPDVSPMFLTGTISGTRLTLTSEQDYYNEPVGEFTFTTDNIAGTWHDHWTLLYEQNVYTATNGLILAREW